MTSTSGAAVTLSSLGRKLEPKPDNDTQRKYRQCKQRQVGKTQQGSFPLPPNPQTVVMCLNKSLYSYWKLAACPNHCSFPHFRHAALFISIRQQSNKSHIISISPLIPCSNSFSNWIELSQHRSNWRDGSKFWNCRRAVTQSILHRTVPYSSLCADFTWHVP